VAKLIEESVGGEVKNGDCGKDTGYSSGYIIYRGFHVNFLLYVRVSSVIYYGAFPLLFIASFDYYTAAEKFIKNLSFPHLEDRDRYFS